jgi:hypothetical protein
MRCCEYGKSGKNTECIAGESDGKAVFIERFDDEEIKKERFWSWFKKPSRSNKGVASIETTPFYFLDFLLA